jgi:hypothetical protein
VAIWGLTPRATILRSNERALKYNKVLGFRVVEDDPDKEYVKLEMDNDSSGFIIKKLKAAINLFSGDEPIKMTFEKCDIDSGLFKIITDGLDPGLIKEQKKDGDTITYYF